jgi:hypothetical protein
MRWQVICQEWKNLGECIPRIGPFLAGWYCREMGMPVDVYHKHVNRANRMEVIESFRVGWNQADCLINIAERKGNER